MIELFISTLKPPEEISTSDFQLEVEQYTSAMRQRWKNAKIITPPSGPYALSWELNEEQSRGILGGLQKDRKTVSFGINYLDSALDYIKWHREFVPNDVILYLFDANLDLVHILTSETTREELSTMIHSIF